MTEQKRRAPSGAARKEDPKERAREEQIERIAKRWRESDDKAIIELLRARSQRDAMIEVKSRIREGSHLWAGN